MNVNLAAVISLMLLYPVQSLPNIKNIDALADFTIYVGDKEYKCNKSLACLFFPFVLNSVICDPTTIMFFIRSEDNDNNFEAIIDYVYLRTIESAKINEDVLDMLKQLGCYELINYLLDIQYYDTSDFEKCIFNLNYKLKNDLDYSKEIDHMASNFYRIDLKAFDNISIEIIEEIISSQLLVVDDEHYLLEFIRNLVRKHGTDFLRLLDYVYFCNLPLEDLMALKNEFDVSQTNFSDLILYSENSGFINKNRYRNTVDSVGIFHRLRKLAGENPIEAGLAHVYSLSINCCKENKSEFFLDNDNFKLYSNENIQLIMFDLIDRKVSVNQYEIKFGHEYNDYVIEGSNDNMNWALLHRNKVMNDTVSIYKYSVECKEYYRYFRIKQEYCYDYRGLSITFLELYGEMIK